MKKFLILVFLVLIACEKHNVYKTQSEIFNELPCPVVIFAMSPETVLIVGAIVFQDGNGNLISMKANTTFSVPILKSRAVGDTLKYCK